METGYETRVVAADEAGIHAAADLLRRGEVVGMPTETVYGLGANAWNPQAVEKIFRAKGRPADNPLIVHIADEKMLPMLSEQVPETARRLMRAFWPGPMTLILKKTPRVPELVTAGLSTVGIRMPSNPIARALIRAASLPIAAPSANTSGKPSPTSALHVYRDLGGKIPLILEGGSCRYGVESTVVDVSGGKPVILRPGAVTAEMIETAVKSVEVDPHVLSPLAKDAVVRSPGMKYRHYAPRAQLTIFSGEKQAVTERICAEYDSALRRGEKPAILGFSDRSYADRLTFSLGESEKPELAAARLFSALRRMDDEGITAGFCEAVPLAGMGMALMNRLGRAAEFRMVQV